MRRLNIVLVLFFCLSLPITQLTSERSGVSVNTYIKKYKTIAIQEMQRLKIPASITLAQGILESNLGKSYLAKKANNHFGIKCHTWQGERAYAFDDGKQSCFRNYRTAKDSFIDHSNFLAKNSRYRKLFKSNDYKSWAKGLSKAGYATDPHYASKLIRVIKRFKLHHYDKLNLSKKIKATLTKQHGVKVAQFNQDMTLKRIAEYYKSDLNRLAYYNDLDPQTSIKANMAVYLQNPHPTGRTYKQQINSVASMYGIKSLGFSPTNKKKDTQKKTTPIQVKRPDYSPTPVIVATPNIRTWNKDTKVNYSKTIWGKNKVRINKAKTQIVKKSPEKLAKTHTQQKKTLVSVPSPQAKTLKTTPKLPVKMAKATTSVAAAVQTWVKPKKRKVEETPLPTEVKPLVKTNEGTDLTNKIKNIVSEANNAALNQEIIPEPNQPSSTLIEETMPTEATNVEEGKDLAQPNVATRTLWHTVKQTETLYSLSWKYNTTIDNILKHNQVVDYAIEVGQKLKIVENSLEN